MVGKTGKFTNCTMGGPVYVYVEDGRIKRVTPLELSSDDADSWEIEARGKKFKPPRKTTVQPYVLSERSRIYSPDRITSPLKRKDFDPDGERNCQNRGVSEYEEISWDEALDIVSSEIKRIKRDYGPAAIAATTSSHDSWGNIGYRFSAFFRFMNMLGFTYVDHNPDSWEGWHWGAMHHWGFDWRLGIPSQYDLLEDGLKNAEMIVYWSSDPTTTMDEYAGQESEIWRQWLKELGVDMVFIDPYYNHTAACYADASDKWFSPRMGTDSALAAAIAYTWIDEDSYDKEYVENRTEGFESWKSYLLGEEDGVPKTPEWAEEETRIPARQIKALARKWAEKRTMLGAGGKGGFGGACRSADGTEWARMMVCLAAMQGLGKPGSNIWSTTQGAPYNADFYFPGYSEGGISGEPTETAAGYQLIPRGITQHPTHSTRNVGTGQHIPRLKMPECILDPPVEWRGKGFCGDNLEAQFKKYKYPAEGYPEIQMFWRYGGSYIGTMTETNRWVKMYRSDRLPFAVNQSIWMEGEAQFADIVLPACTNFERWDISEFAQNAGYCADNPSACNHRIIILQHKCIEPVGESKSDYEIFARVADSLGFRGKYTEGGMTDLDWAKRMFEVSDVSDYMSWKEFKDKGYYVVPVPDDYESTPALRWYAEDREKDTPDWGPNGGEVYDFPEGGGVHTQSGKIEFKANSLERFDPDDEERPVIPKYIESWEGHHSDLADEYPLQMVSPHPRFSYHTHYDGKHSWVNEIPEHRRKADDVDDYFYWIMRLNPEDAGERGIEDGDLVKAFDDRGAVICVAEVTPRVPAGTVHSYESCAVYDPVGVPGESADRGGCVNNLTPSRFISENACGMAPNSCLIEVEKFGGFD